MEPVVVIRTMLDTFPPPGVKVVTKVLPLELVVVTTTFEVGEGLLTGAVEVTTEPDESVVVTTVAGLVTDVTMVEPSELVVVVGITTLAVGVGVPGEVGEELGGKVEATEDGRDVDE